MTASEDDFWLAATRTNQDGPHLHYTLFTFMIVGNNLTSILPSTIPNNRHERHSKEKLTGWMISRIGNDKVIIGSQPDRMTIHPPLQRGIWTAIL